MEGTSGEGTLHLTTTASHTLLGALHFTSLCFVLALLFGPHLPITRHVDCRLSSATTVRV